MSKEVAVIVGAGAIGRAIGRRVGIGRTVVLADYSHKALAAADEQLRADGYDVTTHTVDVSQPDQVAGLAGAAAALGPVSHLVHTAGVSPVQATTEQVLHVDLLGTALVLDEFGRVIAPGGTGVVISSMAGHMAGPWPYEVEHALASTPAPLLLALPFLAPDEVGNSGTAYALSKRGNALRVQAAAVEWGKRGARVNTISPGIISTPLARDEMSGPGAQGYRNMIATSPAGRIGTPDDVADTAAFLLGPQASFITGADLLADGGVIAALRAADVWPVGRAQS